MDIEGLKVRLSCKTRTIGREIAYHDVVGSTNTVAMHAALEGCPEGLVVIADRQTEGRGRRGRLWSSPPGGNLFMSIVLSPRLSMEDIQTLTLMAGASCASSLAKTTGITVDLKWPNDILSGQRKLGGILTESRLRSDRSVVVVVGIGLNVNIDVSEFPDDLRGIATALNIECNRKMSVPDIAAEVLEDMDSLYGLMLRSGKGIVIEKWSGLSSTIGKNVAVTTETGQFRGVAEGIAANGNLLLRLNTGRLIRIDSGDVEHLRAV